MGGRFEVDIAKILQNRSWASPKPRNSLLASSPPESWPPYCVLIHNQKLASWRQRKKPRVCWKRLMKQNEGESKILWFFEGQAGTLASPASFNFYINSSFVLCYGRKKKKSLLLHDDHKQMVRDRHTTSATKHQRYYSFLLWQLKLGSAHQNKARDVTESWE